MPKESYRKILVRIGRRLHEKGFVAGTDGNLSILIEEDSVLITPRGVAKGFLSEDDLITVDLSGKKISGRKAPSSEMLMHLFVYKNRSDIGACCHAHPPFATAFAVTGKSLPANILPEVVISTGEIPLTEYAPPGTDAMPKSLEKSIEMNNAFLLKNHGVLIVGRTIEEAFYRMETVEHLAKITYIAGNMGDLNFLDDDEVKRLEKIRDSYLQGTEE